MGLYETAINEAHRLAIGSIQDDVVTIVDPSERLKKLIASIFRALLSDTAHITQLKGSCFDSLLSHQRARFKRP